MTKNTHNVHVFYSGNDQALYASVAAVLKQLAVLEQLWQYAEREELPQLKFHYHDSAAKDFELNHNLASEIFSSWSSIVTLISPDVFLGKGMVNGDARDLINKESAKKMLLGIYCEKVAFVSALEKLTGSRIWITSSSTGRHLSTGKSVNDEAADAVETVRKLLEENLPQRQE